MNPTRTQSFGGSNAATPETAQYLTFSLGPELYGVDILRVQEIRGFAQATPIPNTPPYVRGVMNLRGTVVPVVDLRLKIGLPAAEYNRFAVIIVVSVGAKIVGLTVDAVSDVLDFAASDIQPAPDLGMGAENRFAQGIARLKDSLVVLLDLDHVLGGADMGGTTNNAAPAEAAAAAAAH